LSLEYTDNQQLGGVSSDIRKFTGNVVGGAFDATDRGLDTVASSIRDVLTWIPGRAKPSPPPSPPSILHGQSSYLERVGEWVWRNKAISAAIVAFIGVGAGGAGFMIYQNRVNHRRKRRAKRAANGARREVVVLAGPPGSLVTKSLMLDLERRGFIVYCVVHTTEEEKMIQVEAASKADIRPFHLNLSDVRQVSPNCI
jgi:hypothetical protein